MRCEKTYDPEKEKFRAQLHSQRKQAEEYIKKMKLKGSMSIDQIIQMSARDKLTLASTITRQNYWTQQTLADMNFSYKSTQLKAHRKKRTISEVQLTAEKMPQRTQLMISKVGKLVNKPMRTLPRTKQTKKKNKIDNGQVTLPEKCVKKK